MATPTVYVICDQNCKFEGMTKEQILAAIEQAVNGGTIGDVDTGFVRTVKTINGAPLRFFVGLQSEYDALPNEDKENLFAIITNDTTKEGITDYFEELSGELDSLATKQSNDSATINKIISGDIHTGYAEKAYKDADGQIIASAYLKRFDAMSVRSFVHETEIPYAGYAGRKYAGGIPTTKEINDVVAVSFKTYDSTRGETHYFYGLRTTDKATDDNGEYVEFACVHAGMCSNSTYKYRYFNATAIVRLYDVNGTAYITFESCDGTITEFATDGTGTVKKITDATAKMAYKAELQYVSLIYK